MTALLREQGGSSSAEVERVRAALASLEARQHATRPVQGEEVQAEVVKLEADNPARRDPTRLIALTRVSDGVVVERVRVARPFAREFGSKPRGFSSQQRFHVYLADALERSAHGRVAALCSMREYASKDLVRKLIGEGYEPSLAARVVDMSLRVGIVDDDRYAEAYVSSKQRAGWGRMRIKRALEQSGVDVHDNEQVSALLQDEDAERARAMALLARKRVPEKNPVEKLARFLVGKGFSQGLALSLARARVAQRDEDPDESGL